jgi:hypothetical protein
MGLYDSTSNSENVLLPREKSISWYNYPRRSHLQLDRISARRIKYGVFRKNPGFYGTLHSRTVLLVFLLVFYFKLSAGISILNILQVNERAAGVQ